MEYVSFASVQPSIGEYSLKYIRAVDKEAIMRKKKSPRREGRSMPPTSKTIDIAAAILAALEDERYDWRTIKGLVNSTGASEAEVINVLNSMSDRVVRSQDADGRSLFTTREHYQKTHGLGDRLLSALADRIVA